MNIVVVSAFRNATHLIPRYMRQVRALAAHAGAGNNVRVVAVEGDSTDATRDMLMSELSTIHESELLVHEHGLRVFGSTEDSDRLEALQGVMMAGMASVRTSDDVVLYVECDIIWSPHVVGSLIDRVYYRDSDTTHPYEILAPLVFAGDLFYDVFAFRKDAARFSPFPPYHADLSPTGITEVDSVGSCLVFRAELAATVQPVGALGLVSWCEGARAVGHRIGVAPEYKVRHPA